MTKTTQESRTLYRERLKKLVLHSLERQVCEEVRLKFFKWVKGFINGDFDKVRMMETDVRTSSNVYNLDKLKCRR